MPKYLSIEEKERRLNWRRACNVCGSIFGWAKNGDKSIYCSRVCSGKSNGKISTDYGKLNHYQCATCQFEFSSYYKNRKYCSKKCADKGWSENMPRGYASRVDNNHKEIVDALRQAGASIIDTAKLGGGLPDLIVGYGGKTFLVEIKNLKTQYGRAGLNKNQRKWLEEWTGGPFAMVSDIESALRAIGVAIKKVEAEALEGIK
jgi:hypothetical protein